MQENSIKFDLEQGSQTIQLESLHHQTSIKLSFALESVSGAESLTLKDAPWHIEKNIKFEEIDLPFKVLEPHRIIIPTNNPGVEVWVHLGLLQKRPLFVLQMEVHNNSGSPLSLNRLTLCQIKAGDLQIKGGQPAQPAFYSNGWQSWSATGAYQLGEGQHQSILGRFQNPMVVNPGTPKTKERNHFSGDMFGVLGDLRARIGIIAGFLSQGEHFGSLETRFEPEPSLALWANGDGALLPAGQRMATDWAAIGFIDLDAPDPLAPYLSAVAEVHKIRSEAPVPVGWCSWYHFYTNIDEKVIRSNLNSVVGLGPEVPLPLFQIDDGFETYPGDWFDFDPGFPNGLTPLSQKTKEAGLTPGIWLAPFIVHPKAKLVKNHPNWLLRKKNGKPVTAGFVWNRFTYALDLTNPEALAFAKQVIKTAVENWGFEYLKLDFLYAAALEGCYQDPTKTRAQVLRMGLEALREAAGPNITLLGCGCPLGSGLGIFEAMRISADVSGYWEPHFAPISPFIKNEPHMPSARNAIQNILCRAFLHRHWWINDPDCLLVRPETDLTLSEVQSLATAIGMTGGSLLLSDDLPALTEERLRIAQVLLPLMGQRPQVVDWMDHYTPAMLRLDLEGPIGNWHLLARFNWQDEINSLDFSPQDFHLPGDQVWWVREFWTGQIGQMSADAPFSVHDVPPNGVRLLAIRPYDPKQPAYIGSSLHISQGMEIEQWMVQEGEVTLSFDLGHEMDGEFFIYLPKAPLGTWFEGKSTMLQDQGRGIYSLYLEAVAGKEIKIKY